MSHPLVFPGKYFFYPIGNTSAVCLTRDLAPEEAAQILLLGCGDPRNVLYTIFCEPQNMDRKLDFTCCDIDPAVLARNVLLFTMIVDGLPYTTIIWNIFFHMYLDHDSHSALVEQCRKLIGLSDNLQHWNNSPYGPFIKMCTDYTLTELRRHWSLYINMQDLPRQRLKAIRDAFTKQSKSTLNRFKTVFSSARSSGPLMIQALQVTSEQFTKYWSTGTTFSNPKQIATATLLNPTFVYSLGGEGCSVHYAINPIESFHLAALVGNARCPISLADVVKAAKSEFSDWCEAFHTSTSSTVTSVPIIRCCLGEATAVCRALRAFAETETLDLGIPVAQWKAQLIQLNKDEYVSGRAPATFNVIETSNLDDHIGLLNILIATVPLLSISQSSVLYTESLLARGQDATKEFAERLYANITTVGLLIGMCPVDYLSGFTSRSNTHELMTFQVFRRLFKEDATQFHQVTTWKSPTSGDFIAARDGGELRPPVFDTHELGTFLYDMYHQLFEQEDSKHFARLNADNMLKALLASNVIHYIRESFVLFLKLVRDRLLISEKQWLETMDRFFDLSEADDSMPMDSVNYQDFCAQLHRHGVYTVPVYHTQLPQIGRFINWNYVPPLVRIILIAPREKLAVLDSEAERMGTPLLQCDVLGNWSHNIFSTVHVAFGSVIPMGTKARPRVILEEDPKGWKGTSSLVASFTMPARLLTSIEDPEDLNVRLSVRGTPAASLLLESKLGVRLTLFSAKLMDESCVHVLPEQPVPSKKPKKLPPSTSKLPNPSAQVGPSGATVVELDEECELVASLTSRVLVEDEEVKCLFGSGATPQITQVSSCAMRITIGSHIQDLRFPFPVIGSQYKLRLARKSLYIDVVVPVSGPFKPDGMKINPFPVIGSEQIYKPWSIHYVNLSSLPILDIKAAGTDKWLDTHVGSMMSARERSLRKKHKNDALMFIKDSLHTIFVRSSGVQGGPARRLFALRDKATNNCDTIFFISDFRFDLHSHTIICDAHVLPLTHELMPKIENVFAKLVNSDDVVSVTVQEGEMHMWKQLLPALVERCRSWKHRGNCEYQLQRKVPLTEMMEEDPLCSCGRGKNAEAMSKVALWSKLAPHVTRIALSPLFAVSYLEAVGRDPTAHRCLVCRGRGKPKLMMCTGCKKVRYCSKACQKKDWKAHKPRCNP